MIYALTALDIVLLVLATMRGARLLVTDYLGRQVLGRLGLLDREWTRQLFGCLFCCGFWVGVLALLSLVLAGGPGYAGGWWRFAAGALALSEVVGHLGLRLGDGGYSDDGD